MAAKCLCNDSFLPRFTAHRYTAPKVPRPNSLTTTNSSSSKRRPGIGASGAICYSAALVPPTAGSAAASSAAALEPPTAGSTAMSSAAALEPPTTGSRGRAERQQAGGGPSLARQPRCRALSLELRNQKARCWFLSTTLQKPSPFFHYVPHKTVVSEHDTSETSRFLARVYQKPRFFTPGFQEPPALSTPPTAGLREPPNADILFHCLFAEFRSENHSRKMGKP